MGGWFQSHPNLAPGSKISITPLEPGKRYRLEVAEASADGTASSDEK